MQKCNEPHSSRTIKSLSLILIVSDVQATSWDRGRTECNSMLTYLPLLRGVFFILNFNVRMCSNMICYSRWVNHKLHWRSACGWEAWGCHGSQSTVPWYFLLNNFSFVCSTHTEGSRAFIKFIHSGAVRDLTPFCGLHSSSLGFTDENSPMTLLFLFFFPLTPCNN